jgi:hypothetical protein
MESWVREAMGELKKYGQLGKRSNESTDKYRELGKRRNGSTEKAWRVG